MTLQQFAVHLAAFGLPVRKTPGPHPPIPANTTLFLRVPDDQARALFEADGDDPTYSDDDKRPIESKAEGRRLLAMLRKANLVQAWHAFFSGGVPYVHVLLSHTQAREWYAWLDWDRKNIETGVQHTDHRFI